MRLGAYDYLSKPFKLDQVRLVVRRAVEQKRLADENRRLRQEVEHYHRFEQIVGKSALMQDLFRAIEKAAPTNSTVLICGETGTGKDLVARALHQRSPRAKGPLVSISCGAIPETLLESELFGHTKGAFTGAHADREGVFESAEGGTLFLDEIGDLPLTMQVKLLRALQERQIQRLGESRTRNVDVRLVSATHKDLRQEMQQGRFREDLYYRLDVLSVMVPPLRQRRDDIPLLVEHFLRKFNPEMGKALRGASPEAMAVLMRYDWPGNVRELQNAIERAVILQDGPQLQPEDFPLGRSSQPAVAAEPGGELVSLEEMERRHILWVLRQTDNHQSRAAQILRIGRRTLYRKIREYGLDLPEE
jgi:DNA-binding NtrC family response regulator